MTATAHNHEGNGNINPPKVGFSITPSDANDLADSTRMIRVDGAGTLKVDMVGSGTLTFTMTAGEWLPICVKKVYSTGTTATGIVGFY